MSTLDKKQVEQLFGLMKHADSVELKLTVPDSAIRSTADALGMDPLQAQIRQVVFFDTPELTLPDGRKLSRGSRVVKVRYVDQVSEVELHWYITDRDGRAHQYVLPFEMRWFTPSEIEHLAARCGFRVDAVYGTLERGPLVDGAPEMLWVMSRA